MLAGCGDTNNGNNSIPSNTGTTSGDNISSQPVSNNPVSGGGEDWAVYWYLCGSDLESASMGDAQTLYDTCLMATVDVAAVFQNFSKYLVASEEVEPGNGWLYSGWMTELAQNPAMEGDDLGFPGIG